MGPPRRPNHNSLNKNGIFLALAGLVGLFFTLSMLLYTRLDDIQDDDLVLGGGGDGLRDILTRHNKHPKEKKPPADLAELYVDDEPQSAIAKFQTDQEEGKQRRRRQGILTSREHFEQEKLDPDDWERIQTRVQALRHPEVPTPSDDLAYDIHNCPLHPPRNYPYAWNALSVLENWNPDDTQVPSLIYQGICVFYWDKEGDDKKAENYRRHEVPFVMTNHPEVLRASERWSTPGYLEELLGTEANVNEHSKGNHFMYWKLKGKTRAGYEPPTDTVKLSFAQWLEKAQRVQETTRRQTEQEHWYFRLNAMLHNHAYLYEELPFFDPTLGKSLTMVTPQEHRGINCRFGMAGTIAESHYDSHNNFIAIMGGQRRYILAHPDQCEHMELYPVGHPSARHSRVNWSDAWRDSDRPFGSTRVNEVLLQPGDILYLPTYWFHFIVSLNITYQCNSRSGDSRLYQEHIDKCGFGKKKREG